MLKIRRITKDDLKEIAKIHFLCFHGCANLKEAKKWVFCNFLAFPRFQYFIAELKKKVIAYILWCFKGGWRKESVLELEQVAVHPKFQGQGIGTKLIAKSFTEIKKYLQREKKKLKAIVVTTSTEQKAKKIYEKVLKVKPVAKMKNLFHGDEIILIRRYN